jgi:hypothetical protein
VRLLDNAQITAGISRRDGRRQGLQDRRFGASFSNLWRPIVES